MPMPSKRSRIDLAADVEVTAVTTGANVGPHDSATAARPDEYVFEIGSVVLVA